jgi:hypothetical protein
MADLKEKLLALPKARQTVHQKVLLKAVQTAH